MMSPFMGWLLVSNHPPAVHRSMHDHQSIVLAHTWTYEGSFVGTKLQPNKLAGHTYKNIQDEMFYCYCIVRIQLDDIMYTFSNNFAIFIATFYCWTISSRGCHGPYLKLAKFDVRKTLNNDGTDRQVTNCIYTPHNKYCHGCSPLPSSYFCAKPFYCKSWTYTFTWLK